MNRTIAILLTLVMLTGLSGCMSHIEDANGPDDHSLATLTDEELLGSSLSSTGTMMSTVTTGSITRCKAGKFSGVDDLYEEDIVWSSGLTVSVDATVTEGNARLVLLLDGEIVHEFAINSGEQTFTLEEYSGLLCLRIAGESAKYNITYSFY